MPAAAQNSPDGVTESAAAFGPRLRRLRQGAGLTLKQLAERASLASSTISKIENDRMSPTYDVLLRLAGGLGIDLSSLLAGASPEEVHKAPLGRRDERPRIERVRSMSGLSEG